MTEDERFMHQALALAGKQLGRVWPNPTVGCLVVRAGRVIGQGATADGGRPHAEQLALALAGTEAAGATAYVTLEPCCHWGETAPCTQALLAAGIRRAVVAIEDPDPRVSGAGMARLAEGGVELLLGVGELAARELNAGFFSRVQRGRPLLIRISSLDNQDGLDAVFATADFALGTAARSPSLSVLLDPDLRLLETSVGEQPAGKIWVVTRRLSGEELRRLSERGIEALELLEAPALSAGSAAALDYSRVLRALGDRGLTRVGVATGDELSADLPQDRQG